MTLLEDQGPESDVAPRGLYTLGGKELVIGVTGWPGVGKSSLINRLARVFVDEGRRVGIVAIDPTSPLSGGGLLGDERGQAKNAAAAPAIADRGYVLETGRIVHSGSGKALLDDPMVQNSYLGI